jgi:hypothetical protein
MNNTSESPRGASSQKVQKRTAMKTHSAAIARWTARCPRESTRIDPCGRVLLPLLGDFAAKPSSMP